MSDDHSDDKPSKEEVQEVDPFWDHKEELLGYLSSLNQVLSDAGTTVFGVAILTFVVVSLLVFNNALEPYGYDLALYDRGWNYGGFFVILAIVAGYLSGLQEKWVYFRNKGELRRQLTRAGVSRQAIIAKIERSPGLSLSNLQTKLKGDSF